MSGNAEDAGYVTMRFGWGPGMRGELTVERTRLVVTDGKTTRRARGEMVMQVHTSPADDGLLVAFNLPRFRTMELLDSGEAPERMSELEKIALAVEVQLLIPSFVVGSSGGLIRVAADRDMLIGTAIDAFSTWAGEESEPASDELRSRLEPLLTDRLLLNVIDDSWGSMVSDWSDTAFELGVMEKVRDSIELPVLGLSAAADTKFGATKRLPCPGDAERSCVQLERITHPDREATTATLGRILESLGEDLEPELRGELDGLLRLYRDEQVKNTIRVVTEPETLIPHTFEVIKVTRRLGEDDGSRLEVRKEDRTVLSFDWRER